jgi:hypothetical protein
LYDWKNKYQDIADALKKNKDAADYEVENALYESTLGKYVTVKKAIKVKRVLVENGVRKEFEDIKMVDEQQYIPPNTTAQIFWLKNRQPKKWRDKVDVEQKGNMEHILKNMETMSDVLKRTAPDRNIEDYE